MKLSDEAARTWSRLIALYSLRRATGDCQIQGYDWAKRALCSTRVTSDLGTEARLLFIASVGSLARLEEYGGEQSIGVELARRRLNAQRVTDVVKRHGLGYCRARDDECEGCETHGLLVNVKEWLHWALTDPVSDEPALPVRTS